MQPIDIVDLRWNNQPVRFTADVRTGAEPKIDLDVIGVIPGFGFICAEPSTPDRNVFLSAETISQIARNWRNP